MQTGVRKRWSQERIKIGMKKIYIFEWKSKHISKVQLRRFETKISENNRALTIDIKREENFDSRPNNGVVAINYS